jgi:hypothetical protein
MTDFRVVPQLISYYYTCIKWMATSSYQLGTALGAEGLELDPAAAFVGLNRLQVGLAPY